MVREGTQGGKDQNVDEGFSIFVDNLPPTMDNTWLRQIFRRICEPKDVYVSRKDRPQNKLRFGFVRFHYATDALRAIKELDGFLVRGSRIKVQKPLYPRRSLGTSNLQWKYSGTATYRSFGGRRESRSYRKIVQQHGNVPNARDANVNRSETHESEEGSIRKRVIRGDINSESMSWLDRSLIAYTSMPMENWGSSFHAHWPYISKVRDFSSYKFLITFDSREDAEFALENEPSQIHPLICKLDRWSTSESGVSRRTWLQCYGVPPHGWSRGNLEKIGGLWGDFVCYDSKTEQAHSLVVANILIDTLCMSTIDEHVVLMIGDNGYDIWVKENSESPKLFQQVRPSYSPPWMDDEVDVAVPESEDEMPAMTASGDEVKAALNEGGEESPKSHHSDSQPHYPTDNSSPVLSQAIIPYVDRFVNGCSMPSLHRNHLQIEKVADPGLKSSSIGESRDSTWENADVQSGPISSSSGPIFPPGFEDTIPEEIKILTRRERKKDKKIKKARRQTGGLKISKKSKELSSFETQPATVEPNSELPETLQEVSENILEFLKSLGMCFEGTDEELTRRIEEVVTEDTKLWAEANTC